MHKILSSTEENIILAKEKINSDELVAFPTETVYGLGGNAYSDIAVSKIFEFKNRPKFNPLPICYPNLERASNDVYITETAQKLAKVFMPGPLTLLLRRQLNSRLSWLASNGLDTVCVRIPSHPVAQKLLALLDFPLAVPSANKSSKISPTTAQEVSESLKDNDKLMILDGGRCNIGIESTIVDLTDEKPKILRYGAISEEEIFEKCGLIFEKNQNSVQAFNSIKHYITSKKIKINVSEVGKNDALLAFGKPLENQCQNVLNLSSSGDLNEAAANFFSMLQQLDATNAENICIMPIPEVGIGVALNDRIRKAAEGK